MVDWNAYPLDFLCEFTNGYAFKSTDYVARSHETYEVFRMGYIERGGGYKEDSSPVFVPRAYPRDLNKFLLRTDDVVIAMTDMKDRVAILGNTARIVHDNRFVLNQRVGLIRVKRSDLLNARFFYLYSNWNPYVEFLRSRANSGVQVNLTTSAIKESLITIPPLAEQEAIAAILGSLDDKIDCNRRMNETLEAMARAIFKDWFVDFGPTRAKMDGRAPYLAQEIWDLFPDSLDDEGKPAGWQISTIGEEVDVVGGSTPSTKEPEFWDGEINWATPKDMSSLNFPVLLDTTRKITAAGLAKISSGLLPAGTVLLSSRAPIGYIAISEIPLAINQGFIAMCCNKRISNVYAWLWTLENMDSILQKANGSTFLEISKSNFRPLSVLVPSDSIRSFSFSTLKSFFDRIASNEVESRTLAQTRDLLLPKLMSGEIRIKDVEKTVESIL